MAVPTEDDDGWTSSAWRWRMSCGPLTNRTLYCLFYATRHETGLQAFRECQTKALDAQAETRAALKVRHEFYASGQREMFTSLHDMGPNETGTLRADAKKAAEALVLELTPRAPD